MATDNRWRVVIGVAVFAVFVLVGILLIAALTTRSGSQPAPATSQIQQPPEEEDCDFEDIINRETDCGFKPQSVKPKPKTTPPKPRVSSR